MFYKKAVLENFAIFTGKNLCWSLFFNENAGRKSCNIIKKRLHNRSFPMNIAKFLLTSVLTQLVITCSKLAIETLEQGVNMFKVNNKDTSMTPMVLFWSLYC